MRDLALTILGKIRSEVKSFLVIFRFESISSLLRKNIVIKKIRFKEIDFTD